MRLQRRGHSASSLDLFLLAAFLTACVSATGSAPGLLPGSPSGLNRRENKEHVVLADCRGDKSVLSSQIAYFPGNPNATPQDVAVVNTPEGQSRLWAGNTTSALFTDTGVTFTAKLGPKTNEGQFAGTGNNGYGNFSCWQEFKLNLYTYDGTVCSQVYDCDHQAAPNKTSTSTSAQADSNTSGLSPGAKAGIGVGVGCVVLAVVGVVAFFALRRRRRAQAAGVHAERPSGGGGILGLFSWNGRRTSPEEHDTEDAAKKTDPGQTAVHEMDSNWYGHEVVGGYVPKRGELDGLARSELDVSRT